MNNLAYSVERTFPVAVSLLWRAWTDPDELEAWYRPINLQVKPGSSISNAVPGGQWKIAVEVPQNGATAYFWGRYGEVVLNHRAEHSLFYSEDALEFEEASEAGQSHLVVLEFEDREGGAWVRYSQFGVMPSEMAEGARQGMESYLDSLQQHLSAG